MGLAASSQADDSGATKGKTFIDYFQPTPIIGSLSSDVWGAKTVGPRDPKNGLEDPTLAQWDYWDGRIIKGSETVNITYMPAAGTSPRVHNEWHNSKAINAVSDNLFGPYVDQGLCWPNDSGGQGHNVTALVMPDGRYAIVVSETWPGDVFVSSSPDGPRQHRGSLQVADHEFKNLGGMSNVSIMVRPDKNFEIVARSGAKEGILGPYTVQGPSIYPKVVGLDQTNLEDPVI